MGGVHASSIRIVSKAEALAFDVLIIADDTEGCFPPWSWLLCHDLESRPDYLTIAKRRSKLEIASGPSPH